MAFKKPTPDRVYVKFLRYIAQHPNCTWKEIQAEVHPGKPLYTSQTEFGMLKNYNAINIGKSGRSQVFTIAPAGCEILAQTIRDDHPWAYDLIRIVGDTKSTTLDEFDVQLTLCGRHEFLDAGFLKKITDPSTSEYALAIIQGTIPFFEDLKKRAESLAA